MTLSTDGHVEALITIPIGTSVSLTTSSGTATAAIPPGGYYHTAAGNVESLGARLKAIFEASFAPLPSGTWTFSVSTTGNAATGKVTINCSGAGNWSIAWGTAGQALRDLYGFTTDVSSTDGVAVTGTSQARWLWIPDCPINMNNDPRAAPQATDLMTTVSPTGDVYGLYGSTMYAHRDVRWEAVPPSRIHEALETTPNASLERFWKDTQIPMPQLATAHPWAKVCQPIQIYFQNGGLLGSFVTAGTNPGASGWLISVVPPDGGYPWSLTHGSFTGLYKVALPSIVAQQNLWTTVQSPPNSPCPPLPEITFPAPTIGWLHATFDSTLLPAPFDPGQWGILIKTLDLGGNATTNLMHVNDVIVKINDVQVTVLNKAALVSTLSSRTMQLNIPFNFQILRFDTTATQSGGNTFTLTALNVHAVVITVLSSP